MCNIAGYAGNRQAAPILLEMLKRQQYYDGALSAGIATIHEGKLYWRKVVGDVDTLIRETDAATLPGTIGIAHTRPSNSGYELAHPYVSMDERMALVSNGTTVKGEYSAGRDAAVQMLADAGFKFRTEDSDPTRTWPRLKNGNCVGSAEVRVHLVDYYHRIKGMSFPEAAAKAAEDMFTDNVFMFLTEDAPDRIFAIRTLRPMNILLSGGESYLASTRFGFEPGLEGECMQLPLMHACEITRGGFAVTPYRINREKVEELTPRAYAEAYSRISDELTKREMTFGEIAGMIKNDMRDIWDVERPLVQHARLAYEIMEQLDREGRLEQQVKTIVNKRGVEVPRVFAKIKK